MTRRNPPAKWVLPDVIDPPERVCYQIQVPDNLYHKAAFFGALLDLAAAYKWADDPAHTAKDVAAVWMAIFNNLRVCPPNTNPAGFAGAGGGDDEFMIRQNPDNPCLLENSVNGVDWCVWADLSLCSGTKQPGNGAPQPTPGGGCANYKGALNANGQYLVPTVVSAGDTVEFSNLQGAGSGSGISWHCPDGSLFFAGACVGGTGATDGGDPAPTIDHMAIIFQIGATWYNANDGTITVPGGVSNAQIFVQVNDSDLTDNFGDYVFDVQVCNNQTPAWSKTFNFALGGLQGWVVEDVGTFTPGSGITQQASLNGGIYYTGAAAHLDWGSSAELTSFQIVYSKTNGTQTEETRDELQLYYGGALHIKATASNKTDQVTNWFGDQTGVSKAEFTLNCGSQSSPGANGTLTVVSVTLTGVGTEPTWP